MLGFLFGFNARLGRMYFVLGTLALAAVTTAVFFVILRDVLQHVPREMHPSVDLFTWPTITVIVVFGWITFTLQSMRIRDIGWDPVCVVPAWIAFVTVDKLVASKIPAWSLGHGHHGTIVGSLVNFVLLLVLIFWPSCDEGPAPTSGETRRTPNTPPSGSRAGSVSAARMARATDAEFGRRAS